ncbi:MAG: hypothetical protein IKR41_06240 [Bacteroidales bacterium]|nr:hypothetical protein [Bacteroidales bacterium]
MEKLLALYFNDDYLQAAVQPFQGKFSILSATDDNRYYFYFRINPFSRQTDFGGDYKKNFRDRQNLYLGDLIKNIEENAEYEIGDLKQGYLTLFDCIIQSVRDLYYKKLSVFESFSFDDNTVIDAFGVFSDNISDLAKQKIIDYFRTKNISINNTQTSDTLAVKYFASKNGLFCQDRRFAVLEALGCNLNMSVVSADKKVFKRENFRQFKGYGIDPMVKVIAEKIVKSVNLTEHIIDSDNTEEINAEIIRHYDKAEAVIRHFEQNTQKRTIKISTVFACNPGNKISVVLSFDDLSQTAYQISRQYSAFFSSGFLSEFDIKISGLENVILVGNPLGNCSILQEFNSLAGSKLQHISTQESENFLMEVFDFLPSENEVSNECDEESTMFLPDTEPEVEKKSEPVVAQKVYREVENVNLSQLKPGVKIYLDTFDPTPGKGAAFQEFEVLNPGKLRVVSSGRSLMPGDIAEPCAMIWQKEVQVDLDIFRSGKKIGRFRTRIVKKISLMQ